VVAALSNRWGWERTGYRRKVVWAELALRVPPLGQIGRWLRVAVAGGGGVQMERMAPPSMGIIAPVM
jgi:hypothetical protein